MKQLTVTELLEVRGGNEDFLQYDCKELEYLANSGQIKTDAEWDAWSEAWERAC